MRTSPSLLLLLAAVTLPALAGPKGDGIAYQSSIDALQQRAHKASPRDRYFIYTELVYDLLKTARMNMPRVTLPEPWLFSSKHSYSRISSIRSFRATTKSLRTPREN